MGSEWGKEVVSLGQRSGQSRAEEWDRSGEEQWSTWGKEVVRVGQSSGVGAGKSSGLPGAKKWSE